MGHFENKIYGLSFTNLV